MLFSFYICVHLMIRSMISFARTIHQGVIDNSLKDDQINERLTCKLILAANRWPSS